MEATLTEAALVEFLCTCVDPPIVVPTTLKQLVADGTFEEFLRTICNEQDRPVPLELEESSTKGTRALLSTLHSRLAEAELATNLRDVVGQFSSSFTEDEIDIFPEASTEQILIIAEGAIVVAVQSNDQETFVERILALSACTQLSIQQTIERHLGGITDNEIKEDMSEVEGQFTGSDNEIDSIRSTTSARPLGVPKLHLEKLISHKIASRAVGSLLSNPPVTLSQTTVHPESRTNDESGLTRDQRSEKLHYLKEKMLAALSDKEELTTSLEKSQAELNVCKEEHALAIKQLKKSHVVQNRHLVDTVDRLEEELGQLRKAKEQIEQNMRRLERAHDDELQQRQDEIDVLQAAANKVTFYEAKLSKYEGRLQELNQYKERAELLESQLEESINKQIQFESDVKAQGDIKNKIEEAKQRVKTLEKGLAEEKKRADAAEAQLEVLKHKEIEQQKHLHFHMQRINELTCEIEQLHASNRPSETIADATSAVVTLDMKEQLIRLKAENDSLKLKAESCPEKSELLERVAELEQQLRAAATIPSAASDNSPTSTDKTRCAVLEAKNEELLASVQELYKSKDALNQRLQGAMEMNGQLQIQLAASEGIDLAKLEKEASQLTAQVAYQKRLLEVANAAREEDRRQMQRELEWASSLLHATYVDLLNDQTRRDAMNSQQDSSIPELGILKDERGNL